MVGWVAGVAGMAGCLPSALGVQVLANTACSVPAPGEPQVRVLTTSFCSVTRIAGVSAHH